MINTAFVPPKPKKIHIDMPKCNLHTHLEGSVNPETFLSLADAQNIKLPFSHNQILDYLQVSGDEKTLVDYLNKIMINYQVLKDYNALKKVAFEAAEDANKDGVIYFELRAGPLTHSHEKMPLEACIEAMLEGLREAQTKFGIITGLIISGLRNHEPERNVILAKIAKKYQDKGVVGFDLAGDEAGFSADLHHDAFRIIMDSDLGITVHAGEAAGYENVQYAIENLNASRIGHGVKSIQSNRIMELLRDKKILLEICPTSNIHTGTVESIEKHPLKDFYDFGIAFSIGDDDPITSRTRLSNELALIQNTFGFTNKELLAIQLSSIEHSFLRDDILKSILKEKVQKFEQYC